jgi:hypothetical protein
MKRAVVAIFLCAVLLANAADATADSASDQDMANRYLQAAKSGDDAAQFYLGGLYSAGVGLPRSDEEAFRWFSRAADQGHSHAMLITSGLCAIGRGVQKDYVRAYEYAYIVSSVSKADEFRNGSRQLMGVLARPRTIRALPRFRHRHRRAPTRGLRRQHQTRNRRPRPRPHGRPGPATSRQSPVSPLARMRRRTTSTTFSISCRRHCASDLAFSPRGRG